MNNIIFSDVETPCFVIDTDFFKKSLESFQSAMSKYFKNFIFSYSVKTNSLPYILKKAKECGCYAEVVSSDEYVLAKLCGFKPHEIIYNGPAKNKETFIEAVEKHGVIKGSILGTARILRCRPSFFGGYDPVPEEFSFKEIKNQWKARKKPKDFDKSLHHHRTDK